MSIGVINGASILAGAVNGIPWVRASCAAQQGSDTAVSAAFSVLVGASATTNAGDALSSAGVVLSALTDHGYVSPIVAHANTQGLSRHTATSPIVRH